MDNGVKEKISDFFSPYKIQKYKKGEILIRADDDPRGIFFLKSGTVKMYSISQKGEEQTLTIFKPGSFFPLLWAFTDIKNNYFFEATRDAEIQRAPKDEVLQFLRDNPDVLYDLTRRLYLGMDGMLHRMVYLMSGGAYLRLVTELVIASKRFGVKKSDGSIRLQTSEKDLASDTGMARETISRELKHLKDKGIVTMKNGIVEIVSLEALERELGEDY